MKYPLVVSVEPATEPVTLVETKAHLRVDIADDDSMITRMITAARVKLEDYLGRKFITQTVKQYEDALPNSYQKIRIAPIQSITSIEWTNEAGVATAVDSALYYLGNGERIWLKTNSTWPSTTDLRAGGIVYTVVAGYGLTAGTVPTPIRQAMLLLIGDLYENREATVLGPARSATPVITFGVEALVSNYRYHFGV